VKSRKERIDEIHKLIVLGGDKTRPREERSRYALDACEGIREEDLILVTAFEWVRAHEQWREMQKARRSK
jgi:hypothetical protein